MALVGEEDIFDRHAPLLQALDYLLGFDDRDVGVVGAVKHDRRRDDAIHLVDRREVAQHVGFLVRVSIFDLRDRRHPGLGVLEEGLEVDDAEEIRARGEGLRVLGQARHDHVPAVGAAHDADALGIREARADDAREARLDVLDAVLPQDAVVQVDELLPEA